MKKLFLVLILLSSLMYAISSEAKIIKLIFSSLYNSKIQVYATEKEKITIVKEAGFKVVDTCDQATILYSSDEVKECRNKPLFTSKYETLKENQNAIGAFYWQKGRPNIIFIESRLKNFQLKLSEKLKKYEVDEL